MLVQVLDNRPDSRGHHIPEEWRPLKPSALEILSVVKDSLVQAAKGFEGIWFTGCTRAFNIGPINIPAVCGPEPLAPKADFWNIVNRVYSRAPLLAGEWKYILD